MNLNVKMHSGVRLLVAAASASVVALGLFWVMHVLILGSDSPLADAEDFRTVDFVRVQPDEELQVRERSKPEPPPPPEQPPPPPALQVQQATARTAQQAPTPIDMPNLNLSSSFAGGPALGGISSGIPAQGNGELIPLVRLTPQYPSQAARAGISGWVKLRITVNPDGSVGRAKVIDSDPRGLFEQSAVLAARRGKFRPRVVEGEAVESEGEYTVNFRINNDDA
jgi:protein TonB